MKENSKKSIENYLKGKSKAYSELYMLFLEFWTFYFKKEAEKYTKSLDSMPELKKIGEENEFLKDIEKFLEQAYLLGQAEEIIRAESNLKNYGYSVSENIVISSEKAQEYAKNHAGELIKGINETSQKEVSTIISMGLWSGQSKFQIAEQIKETFEKFSLYRSNLITHMELATAYGKANRSTADEYHEKLGVIGWKRALTQKDDNVRPSHKENEKAGWIPKNEEYPYKTLNSTPPFDFNCRCSESYSAVNPYTGKLHETDEYLGSPFKLIADEVKLNSLDEDLEEKIMLSIQKMLLKVPDIPKFSEIIDITDSRNFMEYHHKSHSLGINPLIVEKSSESNIFATVAHEFGHVIEHFYKKNDEILFTEIKASSKNFWENFILQQKVDDTKFWYPLSIRDGEYYEHITKEDERYDIILQEVFAESSRFYILGKHQFLNQEMIDLFSKIYK